jgi:hypothetical protein
MPDPKQMSGIPRPVSDLPDRAVAVRLIRGSLSNNIENFPVELHVGGKTLTEKTDDVGRAEFKDLPEGAAVKAVAVVDGERLESEEFPVPAHGGVRLMLVATDKSKPAPNPQAPAVTGQVTLGGQSRIVLEPGDGSVQVYYLLEITNTANAPVNPPSVFMFDMPTGAVGTSVLEGSSPKAGVKDARVRVEGPFPPGRTSVQVACELSTETGALTIRQKFPATLESLAIVVKKVGATTLSSPQIANQQVMAAEGESFIAANGGPVAAGQTIEISLGDMPHHSTAPRYTALLLAVLIIAAGIWAAARPEDRTAEATELRRLFARRQKLMGDLVKLETDYRTRRVDAARYQTRREELVASLEHVYGALDTDDSAPQAAALAG